MTVEFNLANMATKDDMDDSVEIVAYDSVTG